MSLKTTIIPLDHPLKETVRDYDSMTDTLTNGSNNDLSEHTLEADEGLDGLTLTDGDGDIYTCVICENDMVKPRVLGCLHTFCHDCLLPLWKEDAIECPQCAQITECDKVDELPLDYVLTNGIDMRGIVNKNVCCTSCKSKEKAVARCSDCASFLCPDCVTAHQYMRCFEKHTVVDFDKIIAAEGSETKISIHHPVTCYTHVDEGLRYFCASCQIPICNECMLQDHSPPSHMCERITDVQAREMKSMTRLVAAARKKSDRCETISANLTHCLSELESQRDDAKSLINETFQSYKAVLEKRQDALLEQLEQIHKQQELAVWEKSHDIEATIGKIQHGCDFAQRVLNQGNAVELLSLTRVLTRRLASLMEQTPASNFAIDIEFVTDKEKFTSAVVDNFGHFAFKHEVASTHAPTPATVTSQPTVTSNSTGTFGMPMSTASLITGLMNVPHGMTSDIRPMPNHMSDSIASMPMMAGPPGFPPLGMPPPPNAAIGDVTFSGSAGVRSMSSGFGFGLDRAISRQSQSPTISDSGIGMDCSPKQSSTSPPINMFDMMKIGGAAVTSKGSMWNNMNDASTTLSRSQAGIHSTDNDIHGSMFSPIPTPSDANMTNMYGPGRGNMLPYTTSSFSSAPMGYTPHDRDFATCKKGSTPMQVRVQFGSWGTGPAEFNKPHGFCMGFDETIVVANTDNHRIQIYNKNGEFFFYFGIPGREEGQLWYPRKVAVFKTTGRFVVCDRGNERSRMQIFSKTGHFIKKISIRYIDIVAGLAITHQGTIVAVDSVSPTVFTISESGDLIKWFDCSDYMREPSDIAISADNEYYVCDFKGHCVAVFDEAGSFLRRIGGEGITNFPNGIDISDAGDVLIGDSHGNKFHVAVFQRNGSLIGEFEAPRVKVSRCCGLKITSEGYVVTLAKNNHYVIVLNTLYIT